MAKDPTKVCWSCDKPAMFPIKTWYECANCVAPHVPQSKLHPSPIVEEEVTVLVKGKRRREKQIRPSGRITRRTPRGEPNIQALSEE